MHEIESKLRRLYCGGIIITRSTQYICGSIVAILRGGLARVRELPTRLTFLSTRSRKVTPRNDAPSNSWQRAIFRRKRAMRTVEVEERNWTSYVREGTQNERSTLSRMCFTFIYRYSPPSLLSFLLFPHLRGNAG